MTTWKFCGLICLSLILAVLPVQAQACLLPPIEAECDDLERDQLCVVGGDVALELWDADESGLETRSTGDVISLDDIASIQIDNGIALLNLGLTYPASQPDRTATVILFGDAMFTSMVDPTMIQSPITFGGTATDNLNLRDGPDTRFNVVNSLLRGDAVTVIGRDDSGEWLLIEQPDMPLWGFAPLINIEGDVNQLPVVPRGERPPNSPENTVFGSASLETSDCGGALLQSSAGSAEVIINDMPYTLDGTAYLTGGSDPITLAGTIVSAGNQFTETLSFADAIDLPLGLLPRPVRLDLGDSFLFDMATCTLQQNGTILEAAPAGELILAGRGIADISADALNSVIENAQVDFTLDDEIVALQSIRQYSTNWNSRTYEAADWLFALRELEVGSYQLSMTVANSALPDGGNWDNVYDCTLMVE